MIDINHIIWLPACLSVRNEKEKSRAYEDLMFIKLAYERERAMKHHCIFYYFVQKTKRKAK
jgi:hypothetical protein